MNRTAVGFRQRSDLSHVKKESNFRETTHFNLSPINAEDCKPPKTITEVLFLY